MPQMSPMNWLFLMSFNLLCYYNLMLYIYFILIYKNYFIDYSNYSVMKFNFIW